MPFAFGVDHLHWSGAVQSDIIGETLPTQLSILYLAHRSALDCDAGLRHHGAQGLLRPLPEQWCFPAEMGDKELGERLDRAKQIVWVCPQLGEEALWDSAHSTLLKKSHWTKTIVLGARVLDGWAPSDLLASRWKSAVSDGRVSVEGEEDHGRLLRAVGGGEGPLIEVGPVSCWGEYPSLRQDNHPRDVFVPPRFPSVGTHHKEMQLLRRWRRQRATLFVAGDAEDFRWEPDVNAETLYSPRFPQWMGVALASAHRVLSGRCDALYAAVAQGVPAIRLQVGEAPGYRGDSPIPELALYGETDLESDEEILRSLFDNYPWDAVQHWLKTHRRQCDRFLKQHGLKPTPLKKKGGTKIQFCSVADIHYAPSLLGWVENVRLYHPKAQFHLLALDEQARRLFRDQWDEGVQVYTLDDLWSAEEAEVIRSRSKGYQAFSSKGRLLLKALRTPLPAVYCDADIHFHGPIDDVVGSLSRDKTAFVFPHFNDFFDSARTDGLYNAGLVVVGPGAQRFLDWWSAACLQECSGDSGRGVVGDQGYLDFAPVLFPEVQVHREGRHNVARWNQWTLGLVLPQAPGAGPRVRENQPVGAFHAAFPDAVRVAEGKTVWDQLVTFFTSTRDMTLSPPLWETVVQAQVNYWPELGRAVRWRGWWARWFGGHALSPAGLERWVRGWRRSFLKGLAGRPSQSSTSPVGSDWWILAQRAGWVRSEKTQRKKKKAA